MAVRPTDRDVRILCRLAVARWLTTVQIRRAYFPEATLNAVQKRLRKLSDAGYLRSHREHPTAEAVHAVGPKGKRLVEERGIAVALGEEVPRQLEHLLGVNQIRIAIETSAEQVAWCFAYWELANLGWKCPVIPDLVFAVRKPERRTFVVEYDRGTETLGKLVRKLQSYDLGIEGVTFEAVIFVTERDRQLEVLSRELRGESLELTVLAATIREIEGAGFFEADFTEVLGNGKRKLLELGAEGDATGD
jgi:hypothetical protein